MTKLLLKYLKLTNEYAMEREVTINYPGVSTRWEFNIVLTKATLYKDMLYDLANAIGIELEFITESKLYKGFPITYNKIIIA